MAKTPKKSKKDKPGKKALAVVDRKAQVARDLSKPEPKPKNKKSEPAVWDLVVTDMWERDKRGTKLYGVRLKPHNGRRALVDAYQEALDLVVYLRQLIYEQDGK